MSVVVAYVLAFLLGMIASFGAGYVINVTTRVWWLAIVGYLVLMAALTITKSLTGFGYLGWFFMVVLGIGAILSSIAIKTLKNRGYKMFPS